MLALVSPKLGSFGVTAKGGVVNQRYFDSRIALPFLVMIAINVLGLVMGVMRFIDLPYFPFKYLYDGTHPGTIVMNMIWTVFSMVILGVCTSVAWENKQSRQAVRVTMAVPADIQFQSGQLVQGITADMSSGGVMLKIDDTVEITLGESVQLLFPVLDGEATLPATIVGAKGGVIRAQFDPLTLQEEEALTMVLYSRADTWLGWGETREVDRPVRSLLRILSLSLHGFEQIFGLFFKRKERRVKNKGRVAATVMPVVLLACVAGLFAGSAYAAPVHGRTASAPGMAATAGEVSALGLPARNIPQGQFDNVFKLSDVNVPETIELRGVDGYASVYFSLPQTEIVKTATMHLKYHFSPGLIPELSHLKVSLNGTLFATIPVTSKPTLDTTEDPAEGTVANQQAIIVAHEQGSALFETTLTMPSDMLVHDNELTFEFIGHYSPQCEDPSHSTLWADVDNDSTIELAGTLLPLQNDLKLLPLPFYDAAVNLHPSVPIVFLSQPTPQALQAAGIVASWFGILTNDHPIRFPVSLGTIPTGNAIVIGEKAADMPVALNMAGSTGPALSMRSNPVDPYSKLLVISGDNGEDVLKAAIGLAIQSNVLQGEHVPILSLTMPAARQPDDAPRWLSTEKITHFGDLSTTATLQGGGFVPIGIYLRIPPDLYFPAQQQNLALHLGYRYNSIPLNNDSSLQVFINGAYVSSTPLPHGDKASASLETVLPVQVGNMRPFSNSLKMTFIFQMSKKGKCMDTAPMNLEGAIMKDSYLDVEGIPHWTPLPNLEIFANAGYPFTRKADLADTAVVLPDSAAPEEIEMFLTLMGHFGAQTGYPALNVTVTNADGMKRDQKKDYIVLGTVDDQPAIRTLNPELPVTIENDGLRIQDTQGFFAPLQHAWWKVRSSDHVQSGQLETAGGLPNALIEGIEWPSGSNRSVVIVALRDRNVIGNFLTTFLKSSQSSDISQSVSVLQGEKFVSYRIGNDVYRVGSLSLYIRLKVLFSEYPWLIVISVFFICFLLAAISRAILRRRARVRLLGTE
jgi:cellulose synthase (UDP-forming)